LRSVGTEAVIATMMMTVYSDAFIIMSSSLFIFNFDLAMMTTTPAQAGDATAVAKHDSSRWASCGRTFDQLSKNFYSVVPKTVHHVLYFQTIFRFHCPVNTRLIFPRSVIFLDSQW
jgi:hypothetical protein